MKLPKLVIMIKVSTSELPVSSTGERATTSEREAIGASRSLRLPRFATGLESLAWASAFKKGFLEIPWLRLRTGKEKGVQLNKTVKQKMPAGKGKRMAQARS